MARLYRKSEVGTWVDGGFRALSAPQPNGQTLWLYLLTGTRTTIIPGVVAAREAVLADDLRWTTEGFRKAFGEVSAQGMAVADWNAGLVYLPKALLDSAGEPRDLHRPESPNVVRSWARSWSELPECALKARILQDLGTFCEALPEGFTKAYREAFAKALSKSSAKSSPIQDSGVRDQDSGIPDLSHRAGEGGVDGQTTSLDAFRSMAATCLTMVHVAAGRLRAEVCPTTPEVRRGSGSAELLALRAVSRWAMEAVSAGEEPGAEVTRRIEHVIAVRSATARAAGHLRWWAGDTFWNATGLERDLGQTPEQAAAAHRGRDGPRAPMRTRAAGQYTPKPEATYDDGDVLP